MAPISFGEFGNYEFTHEVGYPNDAECDESDKSSEATEVCDSDLNSSNEGCDQSKTFYTNLAVQYSILGWWKTWNVVNRDIDLRDMTLILQASDAVEHSDKIQYTTEFNNELKNIITQFALSCFHAREPAGSSGAGFDRAGHCKQGPPHGGWRNRDRGRIMSRAKIIRNILNQTSDMIDKVLNDKWIANRKDKHTSNYGLPTKSHHGALVLLNYLRGVFYVKYLTCASWHKDRRQLCWLRYIHRMLESACSGGAGFDRPGRRQQGPPPGGLQTGDRGQTIEPASRYNACNVVYHIFDMSSSFSYIGKTNRGMETRFCREHLAALAAPSMTRPDLPCYPLMRRHGVKNLVCIALFSIYNASDLYLRNWESKMIQTYQPKWNTPFVYKHVNSFTTNQAYISGKNNRDLNRLKLGRHRTRIQFSKASFSLQSGHVLMPIKMSIHDLVVRLGDGRFRFQRLIQKLKKLDVSQQQLVLRRCMLNLSGKARSIALSRIKIGTHLKNRSFLQLQIPRTVCVPFRELILKELKFLIKCPIVVGMKFVESPTISTILNNQKSWNLRLSENLECTCASLRRRGFDVSERGHVCVKLSDTELLKCPRMSVQSRVIPSVKWVKKTLVSSLNAFYERNYMMLNGSIDSLLRKCDGLLDTYSDMQLWFARHQYPMQNYLQNWSNIVGKHAVITRQIDKEKSDLCITCPVLYQQRAAALWRDNLGYRHLTLNEMEARVTELRVGLQNIEVVSNTRTDFLAKQHKFGIGSIWHKASSILYKDRPLLSYVHHVGKQTFSHVGRAGVFLLHSILRNDISVGSVQQVTKRFNEFNAGLCMERPSGAILTSFKSDINNFFSEIPHVLLFDAWSWLERQWELDIGRGGKARYQYIIVPTRSCQRNAANALHSVFLKFGDWRQVRPFTLSLRKVYKERPKTVFATHGRVRPGYVAVRIRDIGKAIRLDLENAVAWWGSELPLLQINGSPQGSPLSVFNASVTAAFVEHRSWNTLLARVRVICRHEYFRVLRQRWVDDLLFYLATDSPLDPEDISALKRAVSDSYSPFTTKDEDPHVFVGFSHSQGSTSAGVQGIVFRASTRTMKERRQSFIPRFLHVKSNISQQLIRGVMKGAIMRCVDSAESAEGCEISIIDTMSEFCIVGHSGRLFWRALCDLSRQYCFLQKTARRVGHLCRYWI